MTLKNTSHTGTYPLFLHFLQSGPIPYPSSPKLGLFPELSSLEGTWPEFLPPAYSGTVTIVFLTPQPQVLGSSERAVLSHSSQKAGNVCLLNSFIL